MEAYKSVRPRNSTRRNNNNVDRGGGEATPRYSRREKQENAKRWSTESMSSTYLESPRGPFQWQMPFTVKCIGTFRYVHWGCVLGVCPGDIAGCLACGVCPGGVSWGALLVVWPVSYFCCELELNNAVQCYINPGSPASLVSLHLL